MLKKQEGNYGESSFQFNFQVALKNQDIHRHEKGEQI